MSNVGFATLTIIPSAKGFASKLSSETSPAMGRAGKDGGEKFGGGLLGGLKPIAGALAGLFAVDKVFGFFKGAISEASNLGESVNALNVVFGDNSAGIQKLGKAAAQSLGLSNVEFNSLAVQFSNFAKTVAGPGGDVVGTLKDLTTRASDFASVMNLDVSEAATLFQSGLAGETEPLRRFGIDLSAAAVEAYAYANGIAASGVELTEAEKVQARYGLLMQSTAQTAGDFANTQDSLANVQRRLKSSWADLSAKIGAAFLPILEKVLGFVNANVIPALESFGGVVSNLFNGGFSSGPFAELIPQVLGLVSAFSPLGLILKAVQPLLPQISDLFADLATQIGPLLGTALAGVTPIIERLASLLTGVLAAALPAVSVLIGVLGTVFAALFPVLQSVLAAVLPLVETLIGSLAPIITELVSSVLPPIVTIFGVIAQAIAPVIELLAGLLIPIIEALLPVVTIVFDAIAGIISGVMNAIAGIIQIVTGIISGDWNMVWSGIKDFVSGIWDAIWALISGVVGAIGGLIGAFLATVVAIWNTAWTAIGNFLRNVFSTMVTATGQAITDIIQFFRDLPGNILRFLSGIGQWLVNAGKDLITGLINGIKSMAGSIWKAISAPIEGAINGVKKLLGIHSPSRVFMQIGSQTAEGMALGLRRGAYMIADASEALMPTAPAFVAPSVHGGGLIGALASVQHEGDTFRIEYNDYSTSHEDKESKLQKAQTILEQRVAARRGK